MKQVNVHEAKTHLSRLIEEVIGGEEVVLAKAGKPLVRLLPYQETRAPRVGGQLAGKIFESDDCWDEEEEFELSSNMPLYSETIESAVASKVAEP